MKKVVIIILATFLVGAGSLYLLGFYPVARVNGEFMLYRMYSERTKAFERFETKTRLAKGTVALTDSERMELQKITLQNLIVEQVFFQYAKDHTALSGLADSANTIVTNTLKEADPDVLPRAAKEVYGWSVEEFAKNVLYPQAFQNELQKAIESEEGASFEEFRQTQLNNAQVWLYAVPWKWENGGLVNK